MNKKIFEILVCPVCKGKLMMKGNELICKIDRLAFPVREDIPVMLVSEARAVKSEEIEELS